MAKVMRGSPAVQRAFGKAAMLGVTILSLHCSSDGQNATGEGVTASQGDDLLVQTVHANERADVFVKTVPNSSCSLQTNGAPDLNLVADVRGVVSFYVQPRQTDGSDDSVDYSLECDHDGTHEVHPIRVSVVADDEATSAPTADLKTLPYPGRMTTLLTEDPEEVTPERLRELHLPAKPDRVSAPAAYASWLDLVTKPMLKVDTSSLGTELQTDQVNGVTNSGDGMSNWAGLVTQGYDGVSSSIFGAVVGQWTAASTIPISLPAGQYRSSTWIGEGGAGRGAPYNAMPQVGTSQITSCGWWCTGTDNTWFEYYPTGSIGAGIAVNPGDTVVASVEMVDGSNNPNPAGPNAEFTLYNATQALYVATVLSPPSGYYVYPYTVQWIMERPKDASFHDYNLAPFYSVTMTNMMADVSGTGVSYLHFNPTDAAAQTYNYNMVNASNQTLATSTVSGQNVTYNWDAAQ